MTSRFGPSTEAEATVWRTKCQDLNGTSATTCQFSLASATQTPSLISKYVLDKSWKAFQLTNRLRGNFHVLFRCHESDVVRPPKRVLSLVTTMTMPARTPNQLIHRWRWNISISSQPRNAKPYTPHILVILSRRSSPAMLTILSLPEELVIEIMVNGDHRMLVACQRVSG